MQRVAFIDCLLIVMLRKRFENLMGMENVEARMKWLVGKPCVCSWRVCGTQGLMEMTLKFFEQRVKLYDFLVQLRVSYCLLSNNSRDHLMTFYRLGQFNL
jgi:hypothetical protein